MLGDDGKRLIRMKFRRRSWESRAKFDGAPFRLRNDPPDRIKIWNEIFKSPRSPPGGFVTPCWIEMHERVIDPRRLDRLGPDRYAGIHASHPRPDRIAIDRRTGAAAGERHGVPTDSAAQIQHRGGAETCGLPRRNDLARRLF